MALKIEQVEAGGYDNNLSYVVYDDKSKEGIVIDPTGDYDLIDDIIDKKKINVMLAVNTHGHHDHIDGNDYFRVKYSAKTAAHKEAKQKVDVHLSGGDEISLGEEKIKVMHTPGHSKDSICLFFENNLICGDLVFAKGAGRRDLEGGDEAEFKRSLGKIFRLDDGTVVWPGHDYGGKKTTIGKIKRDLLGL